VPALLKGDLFPLVRQKHWVYKGKAIAFIKAASIFSNPSARRSARVEGLVELLWKNQMHKVARVCF